MIAPDDSSSIERFCDKFKVPNTYRETAVLIAKYYSYYEKGVENFSAEDTVELFEKLDAFRRPERFESFLQGCEQISRANELRRAKNDCT